MQSDGATTAAALALAAALHTAEHVDARLRILEGSLHDRTAHLDQMMQTPLRQVDSGIDDPNSPDDD